MDNRTYNLDFSGNIFNNVIYKNTILKHKFTSIVCLTRFFLLCSARIFPRRAAALTAGLGVLWWGTFRTHGYLPSSKFPPSFPPNLDYFHVRNGSSPVRYNPFKRVGNYKKIKGCNE